MKKDLKTIGTCKGCCFEKLDHCGLSNGMVCDVSFFGRPVVQLYKADFVNVGDILESSTGRKYRLAMSSTRSETFAGHVSFRPIELEELMRLEKEEKERGRKIE